MSIKIINQSKNVIVDDNQNKVVVQKVQLGVNVTPQEQNVIVQKETTKVIEVGATVVGGGKPESIKQLEIEEGETVNVPADNICFTTAVENDGILEVDGILQVGV